MKPEAQRQAIAESLGWKYADSKEMPFGAEQFLKKWHSPDGRCGKAIFPPDYLNDLNAMHEAEKALKAPHERLRFAVALTQITDHQVIFTTAAQRAEAYLRTIGKWEET